MGWSEQLRRCKHGILEYLDSHSCSCCRLQAQSERLDTDGEKTYIYFSTVADRAGLGDKYNEPVKEAGS